MFDGIKLSAGGALPYYEGAHAELSSLLRPLPAGKQPPISPDAIEIRRAQLQPEVERIEGKSSIPGGIITPEDHAILGRSQALRNLAQDPKQAMALLEGFEQAISRLKGDNVYHKVANDWVTGTPVSPSDLDLALRSSLAQNYMKVAGTPAPAA